MVFTRRELELHCLIWVLTTPSELNAAYRIAQGWGREWQWGSDVAYIHID